MPGISDLLRLKLIKPQAKAWKQNHSRIKVTIKYKIALFTFIL
jgi:hypothetical protein